MDALMLANAVLSRFAQRYMQLKKDLPIRPSEMGVVNILLETPGPHTSILLAKMLGVSKPMITAHLTALEKKGYITRQRSQEDRRSFYVLPTDKARSLAESARADMDRQLQHLIDTLGKERFDTLVDLIAQADAALEANNNGLE